MFVFVGLLSAVMIGTYYLIPMYEEQKLLLDKMRELSSNGIHYSEPEYQAVNNQMHELLDRIQILKTATSVTEIGCLIVSCGINFMTRSLNKKPAETSENK